MAFAKGSSVSSTKYCTLRKRMNAILPETTGEITQLATMELTCPHSTESAEIPTTAKPMIAPIMECVVETGQPFQEARSSQVPAASNEANMPYTKSSGLVSNPAVSALMMPLRIVEVTSPPAR